MLSDLGTIEVDADKAFSEATLTVIIKKTAWFRLRLWIATGLINLAATIVPMKVDIK